MTRPKPPITRRSRRDPYSRHIVRLPERELAEAILDLASPLLQPLGPTPAPDEARRVIELAINLWNAHVRASQLWGDPLRARAHALRRPSLSSRFRPPGAHPDPRALRSPTRPQPARRQRRESEGSWSWRQHLASWLLSSCRWFVPGIGSSARRMPSGSRGPP